MAKFRKFGRNSDSSNNRQSDERKPKQSSDSKHSQERSSKPRFRGEKGRGGRTPDGRGRNNDSRKPNSGNDRSFRRDEKRDSGKPRFERRGSENERNYRSNNSRFGRPDDRDNKSSDKKRFDRPNSRNDRFSRDERGDSRKPRDSRDFESRPPRRGSDDRFGDRERNEPRQYRKPPSGRGKTEKSGFSKEERPRKGRPQVKKFESNDDRRVGPERPPRYDEASIKAKLPERFKKKIEDERIPEKEEIRLNKYISNAGLCSRREADELIESGMIKVNGKVITEMGYKVKDSDTVKYGKDILNRERMMYILLNKPKDFLTTMDDPKERRTVMDLVKGACRERVYPVGRLDRNTTGLLLLTNDGELTEKLTHPSNDIKKIYQAELDKPITEEHFEQIKEGLELEDGFVKPDQLALVTPDAEVIGIEIHSGKNRIVRRIFEHLGYEVTKLDRTTFAGLTKKDLPRGKWRFLNEKELIRLKYML